MAAKATVMVAVVLVAMMSLLVAEKIRQFPVCAALFGPPAILRLRVKSQVVCGRWLEQKDHS